MCTIGAVKNQEAGTRIFFKNVDQTYQNRYPDAFITQGPAYCFLKIPSNTDPGSQGVLAGVNEAGVVVLGADGNAMPNYVGSGYGSLNESLVVYEQILGSCGSVNEAMDVLIREYQDRRMGGNGDIVILGDRKNAVALEYIPDRWGIEFQGDRPYLVRSNFFILMNNLRPSPDENTLHMSSAIRYADALKQLSARGRNNNLGDVMNLVRSHCHGQTAMSICRHGGAGEYFTHASFIAELYSDRVEAYVMLNMHPCEGEYRKFTL